MKPLNPSIRFYNYLGGMVFLCPACAILAIAGGVALGGYLSNSYILLVLGCVVFIPAAAVALFALRHLLFCKPYLELDGEGIRLKQQAAVFILWSEVIGGEIIERHGMLFLMVQITNPKKLFESIVLRDFKGL